MDLLKKTILMDLKNHFQRKVSHDQLFSCLIYDFLFVQLVIGPLFVVTWRGTWQNADTLFDQVIFQDKLEASSIFVLILGLVVSAILVFAQHEIKAFALNCNSKPWFFIISRVYTIIRFYFDLLMWKGIWGFYNYIAYGTWVTSLCSYLGGTIVLFVLRSYKAAVASPMGMGIDRPKLYITVPTYLSTKASDSYKWRIIDILITMPVNLVAISAFYGLWTGLDHMFAKTDVTLDGKGMNATYCAILGFACGLLVFTGQFIFVWLYYKNQSSEKTSTMTKSQKLLRLLGYDLLLLVVLIGNVASFRGIWNLIDCYIIPDNLLVSRFVCQFVGLFYLFFFYSGTSLHGGVKKDNQNVMVPNFFLTYLLSNKD